MEVLLFYFSQLLMNAVYPVYYLSPLLHRPLLFFVPFFLFITALQSALRPSHLSAFAPVWYPPFTEGLHSLIAAWQKPPFEELHSTFYSRLYVCVCLCVWVCLLCECVLTNVVNFSTCVFVRYLFCWLLGELWLWHPQRVFAGFAV